MRLTIILLLFYLPSFSIKAQNLVLNWSFEDTIPCVIYQTMGGYQLRPYFWFRPTSGSSDFFNASTNCAWGGVPQNGFGYQYPKTAASYCGFSIYNAPPYQEYREYIEGILIDSLKTGHKYCVSFYISAANDCKYVTDDIGLNFSIDSLLDINSGIYLNVIPQIQNPQGNILNDTMNWSLIYGEYIALGGEKFLTMGNFKNAANTTLDSIPGATNPFGYYFIDDVSVIDCTVGINEINGMLTAGVYPNPVKNKINISFNAKGVPVKQLQVINALGEMVLTKEINRKIDDKIVLDVSALPAGVFFLKIFAAEKIIHARFVKQ